MPAFSNLTPSDTLLNTYRNSPCIIPPCPQLKKNAFFLIKSLCFLARTFINGRQPPPSFFPCTFVSHTPPLNLNARGRGVSAPPLRNVPVCRLWHPQPGVSNTVFASIDIIFAMVPGGTHTKERSIFCAHYISSFTNHTTELSIYQCALLSSCYPRTIL